MDKKTILILTNNLGGLLSFRKEVVKDIIDNGFDVVISSPPTTEKKTDYFGVIGCRIVNAPVDRRGTNPLRDFQLVGCYVKLMRATKPVAVLTYTVKPNIYGGIAARWLHIPQLANITGLGDAIENVGWLQKFTIFMYRLGLKKAKKVFCPNSLIQDFCKRNHIGKENYLLPGSGVNLEWYGFQEYPLQNETIRFIIIGRVMKDKGIEEYFEMARMIRKKYPQVEFHILGRCEEGYEERLKTLQEEGIVIWHGGVSDVRPFVKDSWCTVHPSYHEGMSNVILQSCSAGRPVITSNINGCKEAVDDGVNGYLFKVKDASDLTEKVERFINLPYEEKVRMGQAARRKMEREFDRQVVIDAYLNEINNVINRK